MCNVYDVIIVLLALSVFTTNIVCTWYFFIKPTFVKVVVSHVLFGLLLFLSLMVTLKFGFDGESCRRQEYCNANPDLCQPYKPPPHRYYSDDYYGNRKT